MACAAACSHFRVAAFGSSIQFGLCILPQTPTTCPHSIIYSVCGSSQLWAKYAATNSYYIMTLNNYMVSAAAVSFRLSILPQTPTTYSHSLLCGVCCSSHCRANYTATNSYYIITHSIIHGACCSSHFSFSVL